MSRRNPLLVPGILAAVVVIALIAVFLRTQQPAPAPTPAPAPSGSTANPTASPNPTDEALPRDEVSVQLITDGWTVATLGSIPVYASAGTGDYEVPVSFVPLTGAELDAVRTKAPEALVGPLARVLPQDDRLACTAEKCSWAGQDIPAAWYEDPSQVPGLGPSYAGWEVESLLYVANVTVDRSLGPIRVAAEGWRDQPFLVTDAPVDDPDAAGPGPINGYFQRVFPVAAGLGAFFVPLPGWIGEEPTPGFQFTPDETIPAVPEQLEPVIFISGLNTIEPLAQTMDASALTAITSPSRGCTSGVICTPEAIEVSFASLPTVATATLCADGAPYSRLVVTSGTWTATYPHPTHQFGMWGTLDGVETYGAGDLLVRGVPGLTPAGTPVTGQLIGASQFIEMEDGVWKLQSMEGITRQQGVSPNYGKPAQEWLDANFSGAVTRCAP